MSGIAFERVSKVFPDGTAAVADLNLRIHDGELCVLVGPSAAASRPRFASSPGSSGSPTA